MAGGSARWTVHYLRFTGSHELISAPAVRALENLAPATQGPVRRVARRVSRAADRLRPQSSHEQRPLSFVHGSGARAHDGADRTARDNREETLDAGADGSGDQFPAPARAVSEVRAGDAPRYLGRQVCLHGTAIRVERCVMRPRVRERAVSG